jgi:hypothetical protein
MGSIAAENAAILATGALLAQPFPMTERPQLKRKAAEQRRLSAALRDNLKRRKAQEKAREKARAAAEAAGDRTGPSHDSAGIGADKREC